MTVILHVSGMRIYYAFREKTYSLEAQMDFCLLLERSEH